MAHTSSDFTWHKHTDTSLTTPEHRAQARGATEEKRYNKLSNKYQFSLRKHKFRIHNNILLFSPRIFIFARFFFLFFGSSLSRFMLRHDWVGASSALSEFANWTRYNAVRKCVSDYMCVFAGDGLMRICWARWRWIRFVCRKINICAAFTLKTFGRAFGLCERRKEKCRC